MSIRLMSVVWELDLPDSEKLALLALADSANDDGLCWPSMATLARKCSKSDRTVQKAIQSLIEKGHLSRDERPGKGVLYRIHPRSDDTPEAASPPKRLPVTPEAASDNPSRIIKSPLPPAQQIEPSGDRDEYWQGMKGRSWTETGPMLRKLRGGQNKRAGKARQPNSNGDARPVQRRSYSAATAKAREDATSKAIHEAMRQRVGQSNYDHLIAPAAIIYDSPGIVVTVASAAHLGLVEDRFQSAIMAVAQGAITDEVRWVRFAVEGTAKPARQDAGRAAIPRASQAATHRADPFG